MDISEKYFLIVAEELNMTKAAKKTFTTHQNISQHIRRLEKKYNARLFYRKPKLSLTPSGEKLVSVLMQIKVLQNELEDCLNENSEQFCGVVRFGMPYPRSFILIPEIIPLYRKKYPNVKIVFIEDYTKNLTKKLLNGDIDMFLGVMATYNKNLEYEVLLDEKVYVVIPDCLLKKYLFDIYPDCIDEFLNGVEIAYLKNIPFAFNNKDTNIRILIDEFLVKKKIILNNIFVSGSHEVQLLLCRQGCIAFFCTQMHLHSIRLHNSMADKENKLYVFPVKDMNVRNQLVLVRHKDSYLPNYKKYLVDIFRRVVGNYQLIDITKNQINQTKVSIT